MNFNKNKIYTALIDIDGTIKDLVKENNMALVYTMKKMGQVNLTLRGKFVLWINRINMYLVKTGLLPTNKFMQNILIWLYSVLLFKDYAEFKKNYFEAYNKRNIFFKDAEQMMKDVYYNNTSIFLISQNIQNANITTCEKNEFKYSKIMRYVMQVITSPKNIMKYYMYKSFIEDNGIDKNHTVIIGDNFWDDILPGILLGTNVVWCNKYDSKLKNMAIKVLRNIYKKTM